MGAACRVRAIRASRDQKRLEGRRRARIQGIAITQPIAAICSRASFLLAYFATGDRSADLLPDAAAAARRLIRRMNRELESNNDFLASLSMKISRTSRRRSTRASSADRGCRHPPPSARKLTIFFSRHPEFYGYHGAAAAGAG